MQVQFEATKIRMGGRTVYLAGAPAPEVVQLLEPPVPWEPLAEQPHGNRIRSADHVNGIRDYLALERDPILNALVVYADSSDLTFHPVPGLENVGHLSLRLGARLDIGDGQHRAAGVTELLREARELPEDDPERERIMSLDLSLLIVADNDPGRRAQDFVDLQRNAKPPPGSLGASMDRRHPINRFALGVARNASLFDGGRRIEFLKDSVGKLSGKLYSFQALRQFVIILLIGSSQRTRAGLESVADAAVEADFDSAMNHVVDMLDQLAARLPGWRDVLYSDILVSEFRATYVHSSAAGLYALGLALYRARQDQIDEHLAISALGEIDWRREPEDTSVFDGTLLHLVEGPDGVTRRKLAAGRPAWESAADRLFKIVRASAAPNRRSSASPRAAAGSRL